MMNSHDFMMKSPRRPPSTGPRTRLVAALPLLAGPCGGATHDPGMRAPSPWLRSAPFPARAPKQKPAPVARAGFARVLLPGCEGPVYGLGRNSVNVVVGVYGWCALRRRPAGCPLCASRTVETCCSPIRNALCRRFRYVCCQFGYAGNGQTSKSALVVELAGTAPASAAIVCFGLGGMSPAAITSIAYRVSRKRSRGGRAPCGIGVSRWGRRRQARELVQFVGCAVAACRGG